MACFISVGSVKTPTDPPPPPHTHTHRNTYTQTNTHTVYGSRITPHEDNCPPDNNKTQPLPTRTTIPRTIPHQDNSPLGPLPRNKTTHQDQNLYGGELSSWGVICSDTLTMIIGYVLHDYVDFFAHVCLCVCVCVCGCVCQCKVRLYTNNTRI